jgi:starch synthase
MDILHISTECYPAAKAGGLGDVVGALPKYLNPMGISTGVVIPKYQTKWIQARRFRELYRGTVAIHNSLVPFRVELYEGGDLDFPLHVVDIPGRYDRPGVYLDENGNGYQDEVDRALTYQQAVLQWLLQWRKKPKVLHCHDHHTALVPFLVKYAPAYQALANIPTVFTIHNGNYHGSFSWSRMDLLPYFDNWKGGLLDWNGVINPLAAGIRCCWKFTTVSPGYLDELRTSSAGLEPLLWEEAPKSLGILNGIDSKVWDPSSDPYLTIPFKGDVEAFKAENKRILCEKFNVDPERPLVTYIGRLAREKGADLLPTLVERFLGHGGVAAFVVLGTGDPWLHDRFAEMRFFMGGFFDASLEYNEGLAHQLYAGSDFLLMPSRVEPCGLNQLYALRYGTVPIVRSVGGLKDTIIDVGDPGGSGFRFNQFSVEDAEHALFRAAEAYQDQELFHDLRRRIMKLDYSWERSADVYAEMYQQLM